jgi:hypothetical protein
VGWLGFGGSVIQWRPDLHIGFAYACTLLTWWDMANTKVQKSTVFLIFRIRIQLGLWARIRTGIRIQIQEGKMTQEKKFRKFNV